MPGDHIHRPTAAHAQGFTLVEMLVVLALVALLSGMMFVMVQNAERDPVMAAAHELRATIMKARALAIQSGRDHAITFHIDRTEHVLRNHLPSDPQEFPGRHWYALVGPVGSGARGDPFPANVDNQKRWMTPIRHTDQETADEFRARVLEAQIGPRHHLPRGVRFLALTDSEGGSLAPRNKWRERWFKAQWRFIHPRPWFGVLMPGGAGGYRLLPWGGTGDAAHFLNPPDFDWLDVAFRTSLTADRSEHGGNENGVVEPSEAQPIVDGTLLDARLLFRPDGSVTMFHNYHNREVNAGQYWPKVRGSENWPDWGSEVRSDLTGGVHLTLCRDVDDADPIYRFGNHYDFASEQDALHSILPLARVYVHARSGVTEVRVGPPDARYPMEGHEYTRVRMNQKSGQTGTSDSMTAIDWLPVRSPYHLDNGVVQFNEGY